MSTPRSDEGQLRDIHNPTLPQEYRDFLRKTRISLGKSCDPLESGPKGSGEPPPEHQVVEGDQGLEEDVLVDVDDLADTGELRDQSASPPQSPPVENALDLVEGISPLRGRAATNPYLHNNITSSIFGDMVYWGRLHADDCPRLPPANKRFISPRQGEAPLFRKQVELGFQLPLAPIEVELCEFYDICPTQLSPNGWAAFWSLYVYCHKERLPFTFPLFSQFFELVRIQDRDGVDWYFTLWYRKRRAIMNEWPYTNAKWKNTFCFVRLIRPNGEPWVWKDFFPRDREPKSLSAAELRTFRSLRVKLNMSTSGSAGNRIHVWKTITRANLRAAGLLLGRPAMSLRWVFFLTLILILFSVVVQVVVILTF